MLLTIDDLEVIFPFDYVYPEQLQYMRALKSSLGKGHALLEMPTGTGKTITLLSLLLSYQYKYPEVGKIVYCTRTVHEMNKVLAELENLQQFREQIIGQRQLRFAQEHPQLTQLTIELLNNIGIQAEVQAEEERRLKSELVPTTTATSKSTLPSSLSSTTTSTSTISSQTRQPSAMLNQDMGIDDPLPVSLSAPTSALTPSALRKNPFQRIYTSIVPSEAQSTISTIQISKVSSNQPIKIEETTIIPSSSSVLSKTAASITSFTSQQPSNIKIEPGVIGFDYNIIDDPNTIIKQEQSTLSSFYLQRMQQNSSQQQQAQSILTGPGIRSYIVQKTVETLVNQHHIDELLAYTAVQTLRKPTILGLSLSARTNMCIHPEVGQYQHREKVDTLCRAKTATSVREQQLKSILQRSNGGHFRPTSSLMSDDQVLSSWVSQTVNQSATNLDFGLSQLAQNMGMSDDSLPPPLDDAQSSMSDIPNNSSTNTSNIPSSKTAPQTLPPCESDAPCTNCPGSSTPSNITANPTIVTNPSNNTSGVAVSADIEDILISGLCPYYEGFLSHTNNRSTGYSHLQTAQSTHSTNTPYVDSVRLNIQAQTNASQQQQQRTSAGHRDSSTSLIPTEGVFDINSLINIGRDLTACPYYLARHLLAHANIIVYNYHYMLDPKVNAVVDKHLEPESIVIFDEAHNIDNICIEALSITISKNDVYQATRALERLRELVHHTEQENQQKLLDEYNSILSQLRTQNQSSSSSSRSRSRTQPSTELAELVSSPVIPQDMLNQAVPATIRRARGFLLFLKSLLEFLKEELVSLSDAPRTSAHPTSSSSSMSQPHTLARDQYFSPQPKQLEPKAFLEQYRQKLQLHDISSCKFVYDRLSMLLNTLSITDFDIYLSLIKISSLITLAANYDKGFVVLMEPFDDLGISDPRILLSCVDASIAIQPVFNKYSSVVITSGTLSPMTLYPTMLNFTPYQSQQFTMSLNRNVVLPLIISKGGDQQPISTSYSMRESDHIVNNYGSLIVQLSKCIPDGIIAFFPSYAYMENILLSWNQSKLDPKSGKHKDTVISQILRHKLIFVETKDIEETTLALTAYKRACDNGRGAVFFSIARGKVSEGIDFSGHYGRCVVMIGVPYQFTRSRTLLARLEYLRTELQISEAEYLNFDALRQTSQCLGRIIRSKKDYGLMILADARYTRSDLRSKLPRWIQNFIKSGGLGTFSLGPGANDVAPVVGGGINTSLSIDAAIGQVKGFLLSMATPHDIKFDYGTVLLNQTQAHQHLNNLE